MFRALCLWVKRVKSLKTREYMCRCVGRNVARRARKLYVSRYSWCAYKYSSFKSVRTTSANVIQIQKHNFISLLSFSLIVSENVFVSFDNVATHKGDLVLDGKKLRTSHSSVVVFLATDWIRCSKEQTKKATCAAEGIFLKHILFAETHQIPSAEGCLVEIVSCEHMQKGKCELIH